MKKIYITQFELSLNEKEIVKTHVKKNLINYSMNEILPFRKSYYRLVLANFHFILISNQNYSFCIKLERKIILGKKMWAFPLQIIPFV